LFYLVIMSGKSRNYYHGVPRVIVEENALSRTLDEVSENIDKKIMEFMQNFRINLNVRQVY
jgi:hypothetical protein